jgi:hypothetical protein
MCSNGIPVILVPMEGDHTTQSVASRGYGIGEALLASGLHFLLFGGAALVTSGLFVDLVFRVFLVPLAFFLSGTLVLAALILLLWARSSRTVWVFLILRAVLSVGAAFLLWYCWTQTFLNPYAINCEGDDYCIHTEQPLGQGLTVAFLVFVLGIPFAILILLWLVYLARAMSIRLPAVIGACGAAGAYVTAAFLAGQPWGMRGGLDVIIPSSVVGVLVFCSAALVRGRNRLVWCQSRSSEESG